MWIPGAVLGVVLGPGVVLEMLPTVDVDVEILLLDVGIPDVKLLDDEMLDTAVGAANKNLIVGAQMHINTYLW